MTIVHELGLAAQHAPGLRTFLLDHHDGPRLEAFLLSFDFDQRRAYFGGGVSNESIRDHCRAIDWTRITFIARSGPCCLEAVAMLASLPACRDATAELAVACPLACDQRPIVAELADLAIDIGAIKYRSLIVPRDGAHPDLVAVLREKWFARFDAESIRIDLWPARRKLRPADRPSAAPMLR